MGRKDGAEPAVADRLVDEVERGTPEQDRVPSAVALVPRRDDRARRVARCGQQGPDRRRRQARLVTEDDEGSAALGRERRHPGLDRAREATLGRRVAHAAFGSPRDRRLDRIGVRPEDDHDIVDARVGQGVEDVLEERPTVEGGQHLRPTEPGARAGREHDGASGRR